MSKNVNNGVSDWLQETTLQQGSVLPLSHSDLVVKFQVLYFTDVIYMTFDGCIGDYYCLYIVISIVQLQI
jgi:hypothetical protein